jgi:large subunit ribosomal protein L3
MRIHMMGHKIGMTQVFGESGEAIPVTVLRVGPCTVVRKKTDQRDGYNALVLGYDDARENRVRKSELGLFEKAGVGPKGCLKESRMSGEDLDGFEVGQEITVELFKKGEYVDVSGITKGRGFTGVMKRHNMAGAKSSHGTHEFFRHGGSIGASASPSRVFKGKKMAGRHGHDRVPVQNLLVADVKPERGLLLVRGSVPGPNRGRIVVTHAVKKPVSAS